MYPDAEFDEVLRVATELLASAETGSERELLLQLLTLCLLTHRTTHRIAQEITRMTNNDAALTSAVNDLTAAFTANVAAITEEIAAIKEANGGADSDPAITQAVANIEGIVSQMNAATTAAQTAAAPAPAPPAAASGTGSAAGAGVSTDDNAATAGN